jgi:2-polyprenyl-6-methoxyphenol hydroxylase-like FAD-dependent oxidoreductase
MLLARLGHRVLLLDRATFPSDTLSTHFMHPLGSSFLQRWGLLDKVLARTPSWSSVYQTREGITIHGSQPIPAIRNHLASLNGDDGGYAVRTWCAPRRTFLDKLLLDAAGAAGAEIVEGCVVDQLRWRGNHVTGVAGRLRSGRRLEADARVVIGADGRHSFLARSLGLDRQCVRTRCTFAYYSYWTGVDEPSHLRFRGRFGVSSYPTNEGCQHIVVFGPDPWFHAFRADIDGNYRWILRYVAPELAQRVEDGGGRVERIYGTVDQIAYFHAPFGAGWAVVGDASYNVDQCTAIGMSHAFRDAELLARSLHHWLIGDDDYASALGRYWRARDDLTADHYDRVCSIAEMRPLSRDQLRLVAAVRDDQERVDAMLAVTGEVIPVADFYSPEHLAAMMATAPDHTADYPIFNELEGRQLEYTTNPFEAVS